MSILYIILVAIYIASVVGCVHISEEMSPSHGRLDKASVWTIAAFWPIVGLLTFVFEALRGNPKTRKGGNKGGKFH